MVTPLRDSNPILQESSTLVGLPAGQKKAKINRVLFKQIGSEGAVQTGSSFGCQGHLRSLRMVPFDSRQNFLYFPFPGQCAYLASFWSYGKKKQNFGEQKSVAMATSLENSKIEVQIVHLQP